MREWNLEILMREQSYFNHFCFTPQAQRITGLIKTSAVNSIPHLPRYENQACKRNSSTPEALILSSQLQLFRLGNSNGNPEIFSQLRFERSSFRIK